MLSGSRPESRVRFSSTGTWRGAMPRTASAIALMCAGVVPQQPPTTFTKPLCANSLIRLAVYAGVSS